MAKAAQTIYLKDFFVQEDINDDIQRIKTVLITGVFEASPEPLLFKAAFTEVIVCLNDLLQKAKNLGVGVTFDDSMIVTPDTPDVTQLVRKVRNAVGHLGSPENYADPKNRVRAKYNLFRFTSSGGISINDIIFKSDYDDDICFHFGTYLIYLYRHIYRAYLEARFNITWLALLDAFRHQYGLLQMPELVPLSLLLFYNRNIHQ